MTNLVIVVALMSLSSTAYASPCSTNSDCENNMICSNNDCTCPYEAPLTQNNTCVVPTGSQCDASHICVEGATCDVTSTCECNGNRWEEEMAGICLPKEGDSCQLYGCAPNLGLECSTDGICTCTSFGFPGSCFKGIGSSCSEASDCTQGTGNDELQCVNNTCSCPWGKVYKANKGPFVPVVAHPFGECKIPNHRRCMPHWGNDHQCVTNRCGYNYRCGCGKGATYNSTEMECTCQNGELYNYMHHRCVCYGKNYGQDTCDCPGDLAPDMNTLTCGCPADAMPMPDNTCMCPVPANFNSVTKTCDYY